MKYQNGPLPCATCPWRVDKDASTIPRYNHKKACGLTRTVGDEDGLRRIMACHGSTEDANLICNGYLAMEGWRNIWVRLLRAKGYISSNQDVIEACEAAGVQLHPNYKSVLAKLARSSRAPKVRKVAR